MIHDTQSEMLDEIDEDTVIEIDDRETDDSDTVDPLTGLKPGSSNSPEGYHWCHKCRRHLPVDQFPYESLKTKKLTGYCRPCAKVIKSARRALEKEKSAQLPLVIEPKNVRPRPPSATNEMVLANHTTVEAVTCMRDQALAIAKSFGGRRISNDLKEVLLQITILEKCNKMIITDSMFLAENIDLTTISDEQLLELAAKVKKEKDNADV